MPPLQRVGHDAPTPAGWDDHSDSDSDFAPTSYQPRDRLWSHLFSLRFADSSSISDGDDDISSFSTGSIDDDGSGSSFSSGSIGDDGSSSSDSSADD